jgi:hypothetical protein
MSLGDWNLVRVEVTDIGKYSSLLRYGINYERKDFTAVASG